MLERSGPSRAPWTMKASSLLTDWKRQAGIADSEVSFSDARCFGNGCSVKATYKDMGAFATVNHGFTTSPGFIEWPGPKSRSAPHVLASGQIDTVWIFHAPVM
jgi:hypothetical protein